MLTVHECRRGKLSVYPIFRIRIYQTNIISLFIKRDPVSNVYNHYYPDFMKLALCRTNTASRAALTRARVPHQHAPACYTNTRPRAASTHSTRAAPTHNTRAALTRVRVPHRHKAICVVKMLTFSCVISSSPYYTLEFIKQILLLFIMRNPGLLTETE
jgi:hypothetical protein